MRSRRSPLSTSLLVIASALLTTLSAGCASTENNQTAGANASSARNAEAAEPGPASAETVTSPAPAAGAPQPGDAAPAFTLPVAGEERHIALVDEVAKNKLTVVMFIGVKCPYSNAYNERMAAMATAYAAKGVGFLGINSNKSEPVEKIVAHAKEHGFPFPVLKDVNNVVADQYAASKTPEIFVVDAAGELLYHGRIDENYQDAAAVKEPDLKNALDAALAGQPVPAANTKAFGCSINRV